MGLDWQPKQKKYADPIRELISDLVERASDNHTPASSWSYEFRASLPGKLSKAITKAGRQLLPREIRILADKLFLSEPELVAGVSKVIDSNAIINYAIKMNAFGRFYDEGPVPISYFSNLFEILEYCRKFHIEADPDLLRQMARELIRRALMKTKVIRYNNFMGKTESDSDGDEIYFQYAARAVKFCPEQDIVNQFVRAYAKRGNLGTKITVYPGTSDKNVGGYGYQRHYELVIEIVKLGASREAIETLVEAFKKIGNEQAIRELT